MTLAVSYDKVALNHELLLDLPFREGIRALTHDVAKPHHPVTLHNAPTWTTLPSGIMVLELDGVNQYLQCLAADCADLDFTSGDYSIAVWINWIATGRSEIVIGRYGVNIDGWEVYLDVSGGRNTVSQRHSHVSLAPNTNSNCFSVGWTPGTPWLLGISRSGLYPIHFRNGVPLTMTYEATGMLDPDPCNRDLVIGCRYTKDDNFYESMLWRPRIWPRKLEPEDWMLLFNLERNRFGV